MPADERVYPKEMTRVLLALLVSAGLQAAELKLGDPLTLAEPLSIGTLLATPDQYVGETVQVKGKITEVCQMMGCWMMIRDDAGEMVRIKVNDGDIEFPKNAAGREAIAEGKFQRFELTKDQAIAAAEHEAEEQDRRFDPSKVKGPQVIYQIQGAGAVLLTE
jgi:hypothetical protein